RAAPAGNAGRPALEARGTAAPERGGGSCVLCCGGTCESTPGVAAAAVTKRRAAVFFCEQRTTAPCRWEIPLVVRGKLGSFMHLTHLASHQLQHEKKYDIYFADGKFPLSWDRLGVEGCRTCKPLAPFSLPDIHCLFFFVDERKWYRSVIWYSWTPLRHRRARGRLRRTSHTVRTHSKVVTSSSYLTIEQKCSKSDRADDHYFCHFCDSDGAQDYYSNSEEACVLCEEGRCSSEQFTHAFRTEIDLKAHRTACHSRSRAKARQKRPQIDLCTASATPRGTRAGARVSQQGRRTASGRGAQQSRRGEDVAAAIRASVAAQQQQQPQQETRKSEDREEGGRPKKEEAGLRGLEELRGPRRPARTQGEGPGLKEASPNDPVSQEGLPTTSPATGATLPSTLPAPSSKLKDEDFPSLCASTSSSSSSAAAALGPSGLALAYPVPARGRSAFQEDDFPALVSASKPSTAPTSLISAWNSSGNKKVAHPSAGAQAAGGSTQPPRKAGKGAKGGRKGGPVPSEEEEEDGRSGLTAQELRSVPTTVAVSSLLALASTQTVTKVGKKKKVGSEKPGATSPPLPLPDRDGPLGAEQAPATTTGRAEGPVALIVNGHTEGPAPARSTPKEPPGLPRPLGPLPCPPAQEDFPALGVPCPPRMPPPPGFNAVVLLKGTPPPPPPGLVPPVSKPPPGFSGLLPSPHPACVPSTATTTKAPRLTPAPQAYLVPENFRERNLQLIQSIKDFLQSDEARFGQFKSHSGEFRQGMISAAQYYKSCRDLLGENFQKIFNELLVLLPDTAKQQELLSAHTHFRGQERPPGTKAKKSKKRGAHGRLQVLAHGDVSSHQALHAAQDNDFPSLQAIARILT
uniref:Zinc finger protein 598, E3 ubiquitin ligase n=1 Tax=Canis lupus familiaris TaxID=9615 RepID=A0A8I3P283_CANLF